jgi:hypothetical protein
MSMAVWPEVRRHVIYNILMLMCVFIINQTKALVCGVNSAAEKLEKGENENCRAFAVKDDKLRSCSAVT